MSTKEIKYLSQLVRTHIVWIARVASNLDPFVYKSRDDAPNDAPSHPTAAHKLKTRARPFERNVNSTALVFAFKSRETSQ